VQSEQLEGVQIGAGALTDLMFSDVDLHRVLLRAVQVRFAQIAEGLISNVNQPIIQRVARYFLMYRDRLRSDRLEVTHDFIARM
jgi:CRP-like cAMP-binding protein